MTRTSNLLTALQTATQGLQWMSEADYPFEVFHWPQPTGTQLTQEDLLGLTRHPSGTPVETVDFDSFFAAAVQDQDWHGDEEKAIVQQYQALVALLKQHCDALTVYRVGERILDIYIVGKLQDDGWIGISTKAVET